MVSYKAIVLSLIPLLSLAAGKPLDRRNYNVTAPSRTYVKATGRTFDGKYFAGEKLSFRDTQWYFIKLTSVKYRQEPTPTG